MASDLQQLMRDANALAEQLRRIRLTCATEREPVAGLKVLEQELARTWTAIRLARLPETEVVLASQRHSKWE